MPFVKVNYYASASGFSALAGFNNVSDPSATGVVVADMQEPDGTPTGYTLTHPTAFGGATGALDWATSSPDPDFPLEWWRSAFYVDVGNTAQIGNLPAGAPYTLKAAGNNGSSRSTQYGVTNADTTPQPYTDSGALDPVEAPVVFTGTVPGDGILTLTNTELNAFAYTNGFSLDVQVAAGPSITDADDITDESQTANFTLSGNENAPTGITINGEAGSNITFVSENTGAGTETYSYEPPLIADDDTADLVVSVDGTTAGATIAYANSYDRDQLTHPAESKDYHENSLSYPNAYATTQPYEWKVIADANAAVVTINWNALEADDGFHKNVASYATPVANGVTTVTLGVFVPETGQAYQFDRTITVSDGSVVVSSEDGAVGAALTPAISDAIEDAIA